MRPITHEMQVRRRIGFVSTRFEGTDGVSLESEKWVNVLERLNCDCFFFAGESDRSADRSYIVEEANFKHPEIKEINNVAFSTRIRPPELTRKIQNNKELLKNKLYDFTRVYALDLLIVENALAIPMNIPLGLALTEFIAETGIPVIAHHHDFFWERKRFLVNCVWDYMNMAFPPHLPSVRHVVINSSGANQLSLRTGISSIVIPNVMDFENPPSTPDLESSDIRRDLQVEADEWFFLQPTRVVPRKGIEHAIELTRRLGMKARLVISHASGDEGYEYEHYLRENANLLGVKVNFVSDIIGTKRNFSETARVYALYDIYPHADLVTYPSDIEGFGNAFLEAVYFKRPIIVKNYTIYDIDIKPKGFRAIEFDGFITENTINQTCEVLNNPGLAMEMAEHNYMVARRHYSYKVLERCLNTLLSECFGEE